MASMRLLVGGQCRIQLLDRVHAGKSLELMDRYLYGPAHVRLVVGGWRFWMMRVDECNKVLLDGFEAITTLSVDCGSPYLENDFFLWWKVQ
jgi:hypothetical protein